MPSRRIPEVGSLSETERRLLKGLYTSGPAAYGSVKNLAKASNLSKKKVREFLHSNNAYTQYHIAYRNFPRLYVVAKSVNEIWCMDLAMMDKLAPQNSNVKYLLVCVDILSRFVRVQPMKDKTALSTKNAFVRMIEKGDSPKKVWTDDGSEFKGVFKSLCTTLGIVAYHTYSTKKAAYAERAIRSLKNIMYRYLEENSSFKYLPKLQSFVKIMNTRENRSIKMAPANVTNRDALRIINSRVPEKYTASFRVGDYVRAAKKDEVFRKGYKPQFTREIYQIKAIVTTNPVTYQLTDKHKRPLPGKYYEKQLIHYVI